MTDAVKRVLKELSQARPKLVDPEGYRDGKLIADKDEICMRLLMAANGMGEPVKEYGYYVGLRNIRNPDGTELFESIPEARGMREAGII